MRTVIKLSWIMLSSSVTIGMTPEAKWRYQRASSATPEAFYYAREIKRTRSDHPKDNPASASLTVCSPKEGRGRENIW